MKHKLITLLPLTTLLLTGCFDKTLSKDQFQEKLNTVRETIVAGTDSKLKDVHIYAALNTTTYDYKEGEFYTYRLQVIVLFVPVFENFSTWTENGKYYHAEDYQYAQDKYSEITKEQFDEYMAQHKQKIAEQLLEPVNMAQALMDNNPESGYKNVNLKYKQTFDGITKLDAKVTTETTTYDSNNSEVQQDVTTEYNFQFKNNLPKQYTKGGSTLKYEYGKAKFTKPGNVPTSESE